LEGSSSYAFISPLPELVSNWHLFRLISATLSASVKMPPALAARDWNKEF